MGLRRNLLIGVLLCGVALPASGQVTFRQRGFDATIPDFGGYTPNGGGRLPSSNRGGPIRLLIACGGGRLPLLIACGGGHLPLPIARGGCPSSLLIVGALAC